MELHAVFVRGGDEPVAVFSDADHAQRWRRENHGDAAVVVPVHAQISKTALADAADAAASAFPEAPAGPVQDPDAALRGEIRTRLAEEARYARIEREVRAEMAATEDEPAERPAERAPERAAAEDRAEPAAEAEPVAPPVRSVPRAEPQARRG